MCFSHLSKIYYTNSPHHPPLSHHWDNKLPSSSTFVPSLGQPTPPHHPPLSHHWDNQLPSSSTFVPSLGQPTSPSSSTFVPSLGQPTPLIIHFCLIIETTNSPHHPPLSHHWDNQLPLIIHSHLPLGLWFCLGFKP